MSILYFFIGLLASTLGALPPGASNIAVINTTIKQNTRQAFKIAISAAMAEVILSFYALHCNMVVKDFFDNHKWVQISIVLILMFVGGLLFFKKKTLKTKNDKHGKNSKYITGFFLGILNPPVLVYWILAFGFIDAQDVMLSIESPILVLFLFFLGVYAGKLFTLHLYSKFSLTIMNRVSNATLVINKVTGVLLMLIGIAQAIKLSV